MNYKIALFCDSFARHPYGGGGCYSEDTEILTDTGWKFFKDLTLKDKVFTLNKKNEIKSYHPKRLFVYDYNGEMYNFKSKALDLLVTPNHRMLIDLDGFKHKRKRTFVEAQEFTPGYHLIPKQGNWKGKEQKYFILPPVKGIKILNQYTENNSKEKKILMDDWLRFFGIWLAEGWASYLKEGRYMIGISQKKGKIATEIKQLLNKLPFHYGINNCNKQIQFVFYSQQLYDYLKQFGKCYNKFIPKGIKELSKKQLEILIKWMVMGDGCVSQEKGRKTRIRYYTTSKQLADDLQEIILKLGYSSSMTVRSRGKQLIKGKKYKVVPSYTVAILKSKYYELLKRNVYKIPYKGKIYCCEVKNHSMYVRRNGKVAWCGNSIRGYILVKMFKKFGIPITVFSHKSQVHPDYNDLGVQVLPYHKFNHTNFNIYWVQQSYLAVPAFNKIGLLPIIGSNIIPNSAPKHALPYVDERGLARQEKSWKLEQEIVKNYKGKFWCSQSDFQEREYRERGLSPEITVYRAPNPIDVNFFSPDKNKGTFFSVLWSGKNNWAKHPSFLKEIASRLPETMFYCISDHTDLSDYNFPPNVIKILGNTMKAVPFFLKQSLVFISTSVTENQPLGILEAMSCGLPVMGFNTSGVPEIITHNENGVLVELGNIEKYVQELKELLDNPEKRERLGNNARQFVVNNFSEEACIKKYYKIFETYLK